MTLSKEELLTWVFQSGTLSQYIHLTSFFCHRFLLIFFKYNSSCLRWFLLKLIERINVLLLHFILALLYSPSFLTKHSITTPNFYSSRRTSSAYTNTISFTLGFIKLLEFIGLSRSRNKHK